MIAMPMRLAACFLAIVAEHDNAFRAALNGELQTANTRITVLIEMHLRDAHPMRERVYRKPFARK